MPGKRSRPVIDKLAGVLRSGIIDTITSPRSLLDSRALQSSSGLKSYYCDQQEGIGLGIVVALDNKARNCHVKCGGEILAKYAICNQIASRSISINVDSISKNTIDKSTKEQDIIIDGFEEEFTYVTCHGPNKSTTTRVYYSGGEFDNHQQPSIKAKLSKQIGVFNISSPVRFSDDLLRGSDSDFLSSCYLCRKGLQGKDIYMYRGEKAFCSEECRQGQIRIDERKEQCRSEASRSSEVSSSPYSYTSRGQIFSTGIVAV